MSPVLTSRGDAPGSSTHSVPVAARTPPHQSFWLWVMCLTGVDYFSTLGYQPSIAFEAAGRLAPLATLLLVLVTLCAAVPVYRHVAGESPHGQGSIAMLERLVSGWYGKLLVLLLLGFAATDFVITVTLSSADAAEHLIHNPFWEHAPTWLHSQMAITLGMRVLLGAVFLRGFREVIGLAVVIVGVYLLLNAIVLAAGLLHIAGHPGLVGDWWSAVAHGDLAIRGGGHSAASGGAILLLCVILFPKLALGLSGFETGVAVMPLVRGEPDDDPQQPAGRIRNTRKLLLSAAVIMSVYLLGSAVVTTILIPADALQLGGPAANRALAFLAHAEGPANLGPLFGNIFGTLYDVSTVAILWFAGASALSGLLNLLPRYLPRYGMVPEWAAATRTLILLLTAVSLFVTWVFNADVSAQGGAYATGVMVLMLSAGIAVTIDLRRKSRDGVVAHRRVWLSLLITLVFLYTTAAIMIEKPEGTVIAAGFIGTILVLSVVSRVLRSTELRVEHFEFADAESKFLWDTLLHLDIPVLVPHRPGVRDLREKESEIRRFHRLSEDVALLFVEASVADASEFYQTPLVKIVAEDERFIIRVTRCASIAHVLAVLALELSRDGEPLELHFGWSDESPLRTNLRFLLFGEGNVPWMVRELLKRAQPDPARRPRVVIG